MDKKNAVSLMATSFSSETFAKRRVIFLSVRKTVNIQGYSKLREPIKTRENCYPVISEILIIIIIIRIISIIVFSFCDINVDSEGLNFSCNKHSNVFYGFSISNIGGKCFLPCY